MALEPAFSRSAAGPTAGIGAWPPEVEDPAFSIPRDSLLVSPRETGESATLADATADLSPHTVEALDPARIGHFGRRRGWKAITTVSCILHAAVALAFLAAPDRAVSIEGADQSGIVLFGNALHDATAAGADNGDRTDAATVTLVTMLQPRPVETIAAQAMPVADTIAADHSVQGEATAEGRLTPLPVDEASRPLTKTVESAIADPIDPVPFQPADAVEPVEVRTRDAGRAEPVAVPAPEMPPPLQSIEPVDAAAAEPVAAVGAQRADADPAPAPDRDAAAPIRADLVEPVETAAANDPRPAKQAATAPPASPASVAQPIDRRQPGKQARSPNASKPARNQARTADRRTARTEKPAKTAAKPPRSKAGSGGRNEADARRGDAAGSDGGKSAAAGAGRKPSASGNAAVSSYPGKVAARLRRAAGGISSAARARARRDVQVSFVVTASGGLSGLRIAQSSGSPELDAAALAMVRRAAPFPAIPADAGRSSWAFSVPLGLKR